MPIFNIVTIWKLIQNICKARYMKAEIAPLLSLKIMYLTIIQAVNVFSIDNFDAINVCNHVSLGIWEKTIFSEYK